MRLFAIWSWIKSAQLYFIATICFAWFDTTLKSHIDARSLIRSRFKLSIEWVNWSIRDDSKDWLMSREWVCVRKQKSRSCVIIEINSIIAFKHRSSSFCIKQKKSQFTTSIRKSNASWIDSSKHESEHSRSMFKQNTTSSLRWMIFKRNSKKMQSQLIKLFSSSNRFNTLSWKELASLRSSSIHRQHSMSRTTWVDESWSWMIWCCCVLCKRVDFAKSVEDEEFKLSNAIWRMLMWNISWTL